MPLRTFFLDKWDGNYICRSCAIQSGYLQQIRNGELSTIETEEKCPGCKR